MEKIAGFIALLTEKGEDAIPEVKAAGDLPCARSTRCTRAARSTEGMVTKICWRHLFIAWHELRKPEILRDFRAAC